MEISLEPWKKLVVLLFGLKVHNKEPSGVYCMWYLYFAILLAVVCLGIPLYFVYRGGKKKRKAYDKKNKNADDMNDLDHY